MPVPIAEQVTTLIETLPESAGQEVLDFLGDLGVLAVKKGFLQ